MRGVTAFSHIKFRLGVRKKGVTRVITGTAMAPTKTRRSVTWTDPLRLFRTRLSQEPYDLFRHLVPFAEDTLPLTTWTPPCDIYETDAEIVVSAELAGLRREDIHVNVERNALTLWRRARLRRRNRARELPSRRVQLRRVHAQLRPPKHR